MVPGEARAGTVGGQDSGSGGGSQRCVRGLQPWRVHRGATVVEADVRSVDGSKRIDALDSLRGIAAAVVVLGHTALASGISGVPVHWAVMLFFVLSGFVLALPWIEWRPLPWPKFLIRRTLRLWPPAIVAVLVAAWISLGHVPITANLLERCIFLTGQNGGCHPLDGPLWSLVFEARISAVFPALVLIVLRVRPSIALVSALVMGLMVEFRAWDLGIGYGDELTGDGLLASISVTMHYATLFVFGILLAARTERGATLGGRHPLAFLALAVALMSVPSDTAKGIGSVLLIAAALGSDAFGRALRWPPFRWLGRVSYSLYLIHMPIVGAVIYAYGGPLTAYTAVAAVILSGIAAEVMYRMIEAPSIRLGRWLTSSRLSAAAARSGVPLATGGVLVCNRSMPGAAP